MNAVGLTYTGHPIFVEILLLGVIDDVPIAHHPVGSTPGEYSYAIPATSSPNITEDTWDDGAPSIEGFGGQQLTGRDQKQLTD